ncbi:MAG: HupE/UreJ family protein [Myxococcota bacterium]
MRGLIFTAMVGSSVLLCAMSVQDARAHAFAPGHLELIETAPGQWAVTLRQPDVGIRSQLKPEWPEHCTAQQTWAVTGKRTWTLECTGPIETLRMSGFVSSVEEVLVRLRPLDRIEAQDRTPLQPNMLGPVAIHRLTENQPTLRNAASNGEAARTLAAFAPYFWLGVEHICVGYDHLAFIVLLMLLVPSLRRVAVLLSLFTLAHSITLTLSALGWLVLAPGPTEAVIALSIVFTAREVLRPAQRQRAAVVAFSFGLLHGLGLAGALTEIGLPPRQEPQALLGFNLGVEGGQLLCVAVFAVISTILKPIIGRNRDGVRAMIAYGVGGFAAYWTGVRIMELAHGA